MANTSKSSTSAVVIPKSVAISFITVLCSNSVSEISKDIGDVSVASV